MEARRNGDRAKTKLTAEPPETGKLRHGESAEREKQIDRRDARNW